MRMGWRLRENILHDTFGQFAGALVLFQDDEHGHTGLDGRASLSIHKAQYSIGSQRITFSILPSPRKIKHL